MLLRGLTMRVFVALLTTLSMLHGTLVGSEIARLVGSRARTGRWRFAVRGEHASLRVAAHLQGEWLGPALVAAAIKIARQARDEAGGAFLAVDPKNDRLLKWYELLDFGFRRPDPGNAAKRRLVLPL